MRGGKANLQISEPSSPGMRQSATEGSEVLPMVSWRRLAALVTWAVAVAGCGPAHPAAGRAARSASAPGNMTAFARVARGVHCLPPGSSPVPLPADFVVAAAIRCVETERVVPGRGVWQFELRQVADHGLARLLGPARGARRPRARAH